MLKDLICLAAWRCEQFNARHRYKLKQEVFPAHTDSKQSWVTQALQGYPFHLDFKAATLVISATDHFGSTEINAGIASCSSS